MFLAITLLFFCACSKQTTAEKGIWNRATCQTRPISILQLLENDRIPGGILEILDMDIFGPSLCWRADLNNCEHQFAIPLPFSARSITYTLNHFYVVRDDMVHGRANIYRIADYDLLAGFVFWLQMVENQETNCSFAGNHEICDKDLQELRILDQVSLPADDIRRFGEDNLKELMQKFMLVNQVASLETKIWKWKSWVLHEAAGDQFTSVHASDSGSDYLIAIHLNFTAVLLPAYGSCKTDVLYSSGDTQLMSITSFKFFSGFTFVGLHIEGNFHLLYDYLQVSHKVLNDTNNTSVNKTVMQRYLPVLIDNPVGNKRQIFVLSQASNQTLVTLDSSRIIHFSYDAINEIIRNETLCGQGAVFTSGCLYPVKNGVQTSTKQICENKQSSYQPNPSTEQKEFFGSQHEDWKSFKGRKYLFGNKPVSHNEASTICRNFGSINEISHLAIVDDPHLFDFIVEFLDGNQLVNFNKKMNIWLGGSINANDEWMWEDGSLIPIPAIPLTTESPYLFFPAVISGSGVEESTTSSVTETTSTPLQTLGVADFWGQTSVDGQQVEEPNDNFTCLALGKVFVNGNVSWGLRSLNCSTNSFYICEMESVYWDIYPNTVVANIVSWRNNSLLSDLGLMSTITDPEYECAKTCSYTVGCFLFIYSQQQSNPDYGHCYGTNTYNKTRKVVPDTKYISGYLLSKSVNENAIETDVNETETYTNKTIKDMTGTSVNVWLGATTVRSGWNCGSDFDLNECTLSGCFYDKSVGRCFMKLLPSQVQLLNYGCWKHNESVRNIVSLEGAENLDAPYMERRDAVVKCYVAAKFHNLSAFALQNGGQCFGLVKDTSFSSLEKSAHCLSDGKGGLLSNQVYGISSNNDDLLHVAGPFTIHPNGQAEGLSADSDDFLVLSDIDLALFYLVYYSNQSSNVFIRMNNENKYVRIGSNGMVSLGPKDEEEGMLQLTNVNDGSDAYMRFHLASSSGVFLYHLNGAIRAGSVDSLEVTASRFDLNADLIECEYRPKYRRRVSNTELSKDVCLREGHCYHATSSYYPNCFTKKLSGPAYTRDGWLKSIFSSYEYALIELNHFGNFTATDPPRGTQAIAREECQKEGGDLAYVGFDEEEEYQFIKYMALNIDGAVFNAWLGISDEADDGTYVTLHGKQAVDDFRGTEPNGLTSENHIFINSVSNGWIDGHFAYQLGEALCQRLSERCKIESSLRQPCLSDFGMEYNKTECILHGCCFEEPLDGNSTCYLDISADDFVDPNWKLSPYSNYEYLWTQGSKQCYENGKKLCWELGGELAFFDLQNEDAIRYLFSEESSSQRPYVGFYYNSATNRYESRNGLPINHLWRRTEPNGLGNEKCVYLQDGGFADHDCDSRCTTRSVCQRLRRAPIQQITKTSTSFCERPLDFCEKFGSECHENAHCFSSENSFLCVCNEGFIGDGKICFVYPICPEGWTSFETACFRFVVNETLNYYEAEESCNMMGGRLTSINTNAEDVFIRDFLQNQTVSSAWIGLMIDPLTLNAFWIDGSPCEYGCSLFSSVTTSPVCYYKTPQWTPISCLAKLPPVSGSGLGYVCKIDLTRPYQVHIDMASYPEDIYPGFAELSVNGEDLGWAADLDKKLSNGCLHLTTLNQFGDVVWSETFCEHSENDNLVQRIADIETNRYHYVSIATAGKWSNSRWDVLREGLVSSGIVIPENPQTEEFIEDAVIEDGLDSNAVIINCLRCADCLSSEILKDLDGTPYCVVTDASNNFHYENNATTLSWNASAYNLSVQYPYKIFKQSEDSSISCPWITKHCRLIGTTTDESEKTLDDSCTFNITCSSPPCVYQLSCVTPQIPQETMSSGLPGSAIVLCHKTWKGKYKCPISTIGTLYNGPVRQAATFPVFQFEASLIATFNEILNLGSPPFELSFEKNKADLIWRPVMWRWINSSFPQLVTGVLGQALRFRGQQAYATGDECWGRFSTSLRCQWGLTVSFWTKIMFWPTAEDLIMINTGGLTSDANQCSGFTVILTRDKHLHVLVKSGNEIQIKSVELVLRKWTNIWFSWNGINHFELVVDSVKVTSPTETSHSFVGVLPDCQQSVLVLGSSTTNGEFDLDELTVFDESLTEAESEVHTGLKPYRYKWVDKVPTSTSFNAILFGGNNCLRQEDSVKLVVRQCCLVYEIDPVPGNISCRNQHEFHKGCGRFYQKCPGNIMFCQHGFTISFTLKVKHATSAMLSGSEDNHIFIMGNLPDQAHVNTVNAVGFRIEVRGSDEKVNGDNMWTISLVYGMKEDNQIEKISWLIRRHTVVPFWLQYRENGTWIFCKRWPDYCKTQSTTPISHFSNAKNTYDQFSEFVIGPMLVKYNGEQILLAADNTDVFGVWFIQESIDVVVASDEINMVGTPVHAQAHDDFFRTRDNSYTFQVRGNVNKVSDSYQGAPFNRRYGLWNYRRNYDPSQSIEENFGWLEIEQDQIAPKSCVADISVCKNGFTVQFWFKHHECLDENDGCYVISSGSPPGSQGFSFYKLSSYYYAVVAVSNRVWKLKITYSASEFTLIRISWHFDTGLSLFVNDIPAVRSYLWDDVLEAPHESNSYFDPFRSVTIGRRNDYLGGFSALEIGEIHFWGSVVDGKPFLSLGSGCLQHWHQIGLSCYRVIKNRRTYTNAKKACTDRQASLPHVLSLSAYNEVAKLTNKQLPWSTESNVETYWLGLVEESQPDMFVWQNTQQVFAVRSSDSYKPVTFSAFHADVRDYTSVPSNYRTLATRTVRNSQTHWSWNFDVKNVTSTVVVCVMPFAKDPFIRGCVSDSDGLISDPRFSSTSYALSQLPVPFGSYELPSICRRLCKVTGHSLVTLLNSEYCTCFDEMVHISDITGLSEATKCRADQAQLPSWTHYTTNQNVKVCGYLDYGGLYNCGNEDRAAIYSFESAVTVPDSQAALSNIDKLVEFSSPIEVYEVITVGVSRLDCCSPYVDDVVMGNECECGTDKMWLTIDFDDGQTHNIYSSQEDLRGLRFYHFYEQHGNKKVKMWARNRHSISAVTSKKNFKVYFPIKRIQLLHVEQEITEPGKLSTVETYGLSGSHMTCWWNYNDGSPRNKIKVKELPIPVRFHRYQAAGFYSTTVTCSNRHGPKEVQTTAVVQDPILQLSAPSEAVVELGETYKHRWRVATGSHVQCQLRLGNFSVPEVSVPEDERDIGQSETVFYFDAVENTGYGQISKEFYAQNYNGVKSCPQPGAATTYILSLFCFNAVTVPVPTAITYLTFEVPIGDVQLVVVGNKHFLKLHEEFCLQLSIMQGTNIIVEWDFGDVNDPDKNFVETCGIDECFNRTVCNTFSVASNYEMRVSAMNALGRHLTSVRVFAEMPLSHVDLELEAALVPGFPSTITISHSRPLPTGFVNVTFGDFSDVETHPTKFDTETGLFVLNHAYNNVGIFDISLHFYNNVSAINTSTSIRIGAYLAGVEFDLVSSRFLKSQIDDLLVHVKLASGSKPLYTIDFGGKSEVVTASENQTRSGPDKLDFHVFTHKYLTPGKYRPILRVENVFGELKLNLSELIVVQNPLSGGTFTLVADKVPTVAYPPGIAVLNARLKMLGGSSGDVPVKGWANDVHVVWTLVNTQRNIFETNSTYEADLFPETFTMTRVNVGEVQLRAALSNFVSSLLLSYSFLVMEVINTTTLDIFSSSLPNFEGIRNVEQGQFLITAVDNLLYFNSHVEYGSHVNYQVYFGDGATENKASPVLFGSAFVAEFSHPYSNPGVYDVMVNISNEISQVESFFPQSVHVYDKVEGAHITAQFIDLSETTGVDVFSDGSELYNVFYGKSGAKQLNLTHFPRNRAVAFRAGIVKRTNVSMSWHVMPENITVEINEDRNGIRSATLTNYLGQVYDIAISAVMTSNVRIKLLPKVTASQLEFIGEEFLTSYGPNQYIDESSLLITFHNPGTKTVHVEFKNPVGSSRTQLKVRLLEIVNGLWFQESEPPIANRTTKITLGIEKFGTDSCYLVDPGDLSIQIGFGTTTKCIEDSEINAKDFHLLVEDQTTFSGRNISSYEYTGNLWEGTGSLNFTLYHMYTEASLRRVKALGFNFLSRQTTFSDIAVTELLCDYPHVAVEKNKHNSWTQPRRVASIVEFRLYSEIRLNCRSTNRFAIRWDAYQIHNATTDAPSINPGEVSVEKEGDDDYITLPSAAQRFSNLQIRFKKINGLQYTNKSEDIAIPHTFLPIGLHLICINVAMDGVIGINASDCIYVEVVLPPLVAAIHYGVRRSVGYKDIVEVNAESSSYDPSKGKIFEAHQVSSKFQFTLSCPYRLGNGETIEEDQLNFEDELSLMFDGKQEFSESNFCDNLHLKCDNSYHGLEFKLLKLNSSLGYNYSENVLIKLKELCSGISQCHVKTSDLLNVHTSNYEESGDFSFDCITVSHRCTVPENSQMFQYFSSSVPCIASGYYPKLQQGSSQHCSALVTKQRQSCGSLLIDTSQLKSGESYMTRVRMKDPHTDRVSYSFQVLDVSTGDPLKLSIVCVFNCNLKTNTRTSLTLRANSNAYLIGNTAGSVNETFSGTNSSTSFRWSLFVSNGLKKRRRREASDEQFVQVPNFHELSSVGLSKPHLVIRPHSLIAGRKYRVRVVGEFGLATPGLSETELFTNLPPYGGSCAIQPTEGIAMNDTFSIMCSGWLDEGLNLDRTTPISANDFTLIYQVFVYATSHSTPSLLSFGNSAAIMDKFLPAGAADEDFRVRVEIRILDEYGESVVVNKTVRVLTPQVVSANALLNITATEITTSGTQGVSQLSSAVSTLLNAEGSKALNTSASEEELREKESAKQQRAAMRATLVDAVVSRINSDSDLDGIQQSCSAISDLTYVSEETDDETQRKAAAALAERAKSIMSLSSIKPSEDIKETAAVMVDGIDNILKASRNQLVSNLQLSSSIDSLVRVPVFTKTQSSNISPKAVINEEEAFLSPEERLERRSVQEKQANEVYEKRRQQSRIVGNQAVKSMSTLSSAVLQRMIPGEPSVDLSSRGFDLRSKKTTTADFCHQASNTGSQTQGTSQSRSTRGRISLNQCGDTGSSSEETVDTELLTLEQNPFIWDDSADNVRSSVVSLTITTSNGSNPFQNTSNVYRLELPINPNLSSVPPQSFNFTPSGIDGMSYHEFISATTDDVIFLTILPQNVTEQIRLRVYFLITDKYDTFPSTENNTFVIELPDPVYVDNPYRIRFNGSELQEKSRYVLGIHEIDDIGNVTREENMTLSTYLLTTVVTSCRFWNETTEKWETTGCELSSETNSQVVICLCNHLTSFGAGFLVAPNPIDFSKLADKLKNLKDNLAVLLTLVILLVLYIAGLLVCRRQDKKDVKKWSISLLKDNRLNGDFFYQITVKTGWNRNADTTSRVHFVLSGENADTGIRTLADSEETKFERGSVRKFLLNSDRSLGNLSWIKIWHDNSGQNSLGSWYLDHLVVTDLQSNKRNYFICNDWLAVDESDGRVERVIPVAGDQQIGSFRHLFTSSTKRDFSDGHLWFSLFSRPTKSNFTRVQRLSCAFTLLLSTMLTSAMFYGKDSDDSGQQGRIDIGPISLSVQQLLISVQASFIVLPINILLVQMFRRIRQKDSDVHIGKSVGSLLKNSTLDNLKENEANENENENDNSSSKKRTLPYWFVYIIWSMMFVVAAVSASFVFIYSIEWGPQKSNDWLLSICLSFTQSIFVVQPAKVVIGAVVVSFLINRFAVEKAEAMVEEDKQIDIDMNDLKQKEEEWLMQSPSDDYYGQVTENHAPSPEELEEARIQRKHHKRMIETMHDIGSYMLYVILLLIATNVAKDPHSFLMHDSISEIFLEADPLFEEVRTIENFWEWSDAVLVEGLHAGNWYNGRRVTWMETRFLSNRETFVIGPARIRQVRLRQGDCVVNRTITTSTKDCLEGYDIVNQETESFSEGWVSRTDKESAAEPWRFQNFLKLGGFPYSGLMKWYDGGGYSATLGNTAHGSRSILHKLKNKNWLDRNTAAIFVEFTVYNANINLFASCIFLFERSENGAFFGYPSITPIRLYEFIDGKGTLLIVIYVIFALYHVYKLYKIFSLFQTIKKKFFYSFWNVVDLVSSLLSICAITMYAVRTINVNSTLEKLTNDVDKETFVNFQYITLCNDLFRYFMAFILFLATTKFNQLLAFNRRIRLLAYTLRCAAKPIAYFMAMFSIYFAAFLFLANIWFEQKLYPYSTLYLTAEEMMSMLLGRFDFTELEIADRFLGPIFFITFAGLCTILLINMFVVILDESIKAARKEVDATDNEFEMVEYVMKQVGATFYNLAPKWFIKNMGPQKVMTNGITDTPMDTLERRVDALTQIVTNMEIEFYSQTSVEELESEFEAASNEPDDPIYEELLY